MICPLTDTESAFLYQKLGNAVAADFIEEMRKEAQFTGPEGFADTSNRRFPIFNEKVAALSSVYAELQDTAAPVKERIKEALDLYNIEVQIPQAKTAAELPAESYLLPQHRKVRIESADDVKVAEELLAIRRTDMDLLTRTYAYRRLQEKAAEFKVELSDDVKAYGATGRCHVPSLCSAIQARREHTLNDNVKQAFETLEQQLRATKLAFIDDDEEKDKLAQTLADLDQMASIEYRYNRPGRLGFPDPILSVFNTNKRADEFINMAGHEVPLDRVQAIDPESLSDIIGPEFIEDVRGANGEVDPQEMAQVLSVLPSDMQQEVIQRLGLA